MVYYQFYSPCVRLSVVHTQHQEYQYNFKVIIGKFTQCLSTRETIAEIHSKTPKHCQSLIANDRSLPNVSSQLIRAITDTNVYRCHLKSKFFFVQCGHFIAQSFCMSSLDNINRTTTKTSAHHPCTEDLGAVLYR